MPLGITVKERLSAMLKSMNLKNNIIEITLRYLTKITILFIQTKEHFVIVIRFYS